MNHLDFHQVLRDENGRLLKSVNLDLAGLIAHLDEVHIGRTAEGHSIIQLALGLEG